MAWIFRDGSATGRDASKLKYLLNLRIRSAQITDTSTAVRNCGDKSGLIELPNLIEETERRLGAYPVV